MFCFNGLIHNNPTFDLDNGLVPNRRKAIVWTNADPIHYRIYAALGEEKSKWNGGIILYIFDRGIICQTSKSKHSSVMVNRWNFTLDFVVRLLYSVVIKISQTYIGIF